MKTFSQKRLDKLKKSEKEKLKVACLERHKHATSHDFLANTPFRQGRVVFFAGKPPAKNLHPTLDLTTKEGGAGKIVSKGSGINACEAIASRFQRYF